MPKLEAMSLKELQALSELSPATLKAVRAGRMPNPRNRAKLLSILADAEQDKPG